MVALLVNSRVMAEKMAVKKRTLERDIAELQKCGILKREGGKNNSPTSLRNQIKEYTFEVKSIFIIG
jgi:DeoR/GlpR family transcriptional regulator of sugar metabolism